MKKLLLLLLAGMLLAGGLVAPIIADVEDVSKDELISAITNARAIVIGVKQVGWKIWLKANWIFFLGFLVGVAHIVVKWTKTKKDDNFFKKYILRPFRWLLQIVSLDFKDFKNDVKGINPEKK